MRFILRLLALFWLAFTAQAWQLELRDHQGVPALWLGNAESLSGANVYLAWYDADAAPGQQVFSWRLDGAWQPGMAPVNPQPFDVPVFAATPFPGIGLPDTCPDQHRCFIGLLALQPGDNPLQPALWQRASLLPLSLQAAQDRLPGQTLFASSGQVWRGGLYPTTDDAFSGAPETSDSAPPASTEKPDIFRLDGTQVLYANGQAEKFQVIETVDPAHPALRAQADLIGSPREVYALGGYYVLLQGGNLVKSYATVLAPGADGQLSQVAQSELAGAFVESRRRNEVIYTVSQEWNNGSQLHITALRLATDGSLKQVARADLPGYEAKVAIFQDYLVIANHDPNNWWHSQVQVYDLSQGGLTALPILRVAGQIPSEFHLDARDGLLRLVYGTADRALGSTLAIYRLPDLTLLGQVGKIAPGESLFATRFVDTLAFVVTYQSTDPLWVIDLSNPAQPVIKGELHVPGWSEKLFFHDHRLFAVGIDDQPAPGENLTWARRAAMSLFDVRDPTRPALLDRFTPLTGEVSWSWSPALDDERALLLDWPNAFAALPLESWETQAGSHLQLVQFGQDKFTDAGRLDLTAPVLRSLTLGPDWLGVLGEQSFFSVEWGKGAPRVLGELELAANLTWLRASSSTGSPSTGSGGGGGTLWAAAQGRGGYYRLYRYPLPLAEKPAQRWSLPRGYEGVALDDQRALFYTRNPLAFQVIDLAGGEVWPAEQLEKTDGNLWYQRSLPLLRGDTLYLAEYQALNAVYPAAESERLNYDPSTGIWQLRAWQLTPTGAVVKPAYTLPGEPLGLTPDNRLLTQEYTAEGKLRLNLLALESTQARLLDSLSVEQCGNSSPLWDGKQLYLSCLLSYAYPVGYRADLAGAVAPEPQPALRLLRITADNRLHLAGEWEFPDSRQLLAADNERVMLGTIYSYWGYGVMDMSIMPPASSGCELYSLAGGAKPELLKTVETCPWSGEAVALTADRGYLAKGFAGIESFGW